MILDDAKDICFLICRVADKDGHDVLVQSNTKTIETAYLSHRPDIILLDLQMPGMDGIEILRMLAKHESGAAITVMSGVDGEIIHTTMELGKAMGLNMVGILSKPLDLVKLKEILNKKHYGRIQLFNQNKEILREDLVQAIEDDRILVYYQPKIDISSRIVIGVEALVRMLDEKMKIIMPNQFIPLAEATGLIGPLTYKVIEIILEEMKIWHGITQDDKTISVNISPILLSDLEIPDKLEQIIRSYNYSPTQFILEITESATMHDQVSVMDILTRLRLKGFKLSIDDFGTGYATYKSLYQQPFCEIKIDKSFVIQASKNEYAAMIIKSVIELSQKFNLNVVAEGIEDEESLNWLASINCKSGQGYYICKPLPANQFKSWLEQYSESNGTKALAHK